ncbi:hypothetical protein COOONC_00331 [Cooperia oncophora]
MLSRLCKISYGSLNRIQELHFSLFSSFEGINWRETLSSSKPAHRIRTRYLRQAHLHQLLKSH